MGETKQELVEEFRHNTILKAARHVVAQRGIGGASMQAIADAAGVAKGTLYLYFDGRTDLLEQATGRVFDELLAHLETELPPGRPLREALRALVRTVLEFFDAHREFLRVYVEMRGPQGAACQRRQRRPQYARYLEHLQGFLAEAARRGELKAFEPARVALFLAEGMSAIVKQRLDERGRKTSEDVEWIVELLLDGMCKQTRR